MQIPDEAIHLVAERMFRRYESEYSASHLTWRDFADDARADLEAAAPLLERAICRKMARDILALAAEDENAEKKGARHAGPYGDMRTSLRRLARGEPLPDAMDLRGGVEDGGNGH